MDVEHKKTALDDDSEIYKSRDNSFGKKDIRSLSGKQKLEYFRDYYLLKVVVIAAALLVVGVLLNSAVFNRSECRMALVLLNESQLTEYVALNEAIDEYLDLENKNDYTSVENYYLEDPQMQMAYVTKNGAGAIDVIICPKDYFEKEAARGMFMDLSEVLPEDTYEELSGRMVEAREGKDQDTEGNILSYYEPAPFGLDLSGSDHLEEFGGHGEDSVLCVSRGSVNTENVIKIITYFMEDTK